MCELQGSVAANACICVNRFGEAMCFDEQNSINNAEPVTSEAEVTTELEPIEQAEPCHEDKHGKPAWDEPLDEAWGRAITVNCAEDEELGGAATDVVEQSAPKARKKLERTFNVVLIVVIGVLIALNLCKIFVLSQVGIEQSSMQPTYDPGEAVLINKLITPTNGDVVVVYKQDIDSRFKAYFASSADKSANGKYALLIKRAVAVGGNQVWSEQVGEQYALAVRIDGVTYYEFYAWSAPQGNKSYADSDKGKYVLAEGLEQAKTDHGENVTQLLMSDIGWLADYTQDNPYTLKENELLLLGDNREVSKDSRQSGVSNLSRLLGVVVK